MVPDGEMIVCRFAQVRAFANITLVGVNKGLDKWLWLKF